MPNSRCAPGEAVRTYALTVTLVSTSTGSDLSGVATVLHRRGIDVIDAALSRSENGRRRFSATVAVSPERARTLAATLHNMVNVIDVATDAAPICG